MSRKYLVLGGTGYIGGKIVSELFEQQKDVTVVGRRSVEALTKQGIKVINVDMTDEESVEKVFLEKYDYVINAMGDVDHSLMTSGKGYQVIEAHLLSTLLIFKYLDTNTLKKYLHIGSADEYPQSDRFLSESLREMPVSPYSFSKTSVAHFLQMLYLSEGVPTAIARVFLTYGPGQNVERFIPQIIKSAINGKKIETTYGEQIRDFCFIDDLVEGILLALHSEKANGQILNIASGKEVEIRSVVDYIARKFNGDVEFGARPYRENESMYQVADVLKMNELLGWKAKTPFEVGIDRTIEWCVKNEK